MTLQLAGIFLHKISIIFNRHMSRNMGYLRMAISKKSIADYSIA